MADFFLSKDVWYWMTTYSPSGAPGRVVAYCLDFTFRERTLPKGFLAAVREACHWSLLTAALRYAAETSQLFEY